ncbi:hypothetical protein D3C80_1321360 [compost metagenome]
MSFSNLAKHILNRHLHILKIQRARRRALDAHLMLLRPDTEAWEAPLDNEGGKMHPVNLRIHDKNISEARVRNIQLRAVQHVMAAVLRQLRRRPCPQCI